MDEFVVRVRWCLVKSRMMSQVAFNRDLHKVA